MLDGQYLQGIGMKLKLLFTIVLLVVLAIFIFDEKTELAKGLEAEHIIDWHTHVAGLGYGDTGNFINQDMRDNFRFGFFMKWMDVTEDEIQRQGDQLVVQRLSKKIAQSKYVDQAVVLALDGIIDEQTGELDKVNTQFYVANDFVVEETRKYSNLLFGASINPKRKNSIELLEQAVEDGALLIKWLPSIMWIDPADSQFEAFYKRMAELNVPLLTHTGMEKSFPNARDELADPRRLELALKCGVIVIAAHIATTGESEGEDNFQRILPMFQEYPNLYTDISSLTQINKLGYLAKAVNAPGLQEKMIYGTDWPLQYFPLVSPWFHVNHIGFKNAWYLSQVENQWDRDIELKRVFGISDSVLMRTPGRVDISRVNMDQVNKVIKN